MTYRYPRFMDRRPTIRAFCESESGCERLRHSVSSRRRSCSAGAAVEGESEGGYCMVALEARHMRFARLILGSLMVVSLPGTVQAQNAPAPFQDHYADVNGVRLHYASVGQGPLVLFLHGYPAFWYQWKDQMLEMGRDHLTVGLDMRGFNLSSKPQCLEPYRMNHLVEDVRQVAEQIAGKGKK